MEDAAETDHRRDMRPSFDLNETVRRALYALHDRKRDVIIAALYLVVAPLALIALLSIGVSSQFLPRGFSAGFLFFTIFTLSVYFVTYVFFSVVVLLLIVPEFWGERTSLKDAWATTLSRIWPLMGVMILFSLAVSVGLALLIIPGLFLLCCWYVCLPVMIGENRGVFDSLERSWDLTQGYRGFILVILVVPTVIVSLVTYAIDYMLFSALSVLLNIVIEALWLSVSAALIGSVYYELLQVKGEYNGASDAEATVG